MYYKKLNKIIALFLVLSIGLLSLGVNIAWGHGVGLAPNDDFDFATQITNLPFSESIDTTETTLASDDPGDACGDGYFDYGKTVWYSITPASDMILSISRTDSSYRADVYVFTGSRGSLTQVAGYCDEGNTDIHIRVSSETTYYMMVAAGNYYWEGDPTGGILGLSIWELPPPPNDDFANATIVNSLPFVESIDTESATWEPNELNPCNMTDRTVWYAFTPESSATYTAKASYPGIGALAAYTGGSLESLTEQGCTDGYSGNQVTLQMQAGTTYYFQTANLTSWMGWDLTFSLDLTPPPNVEYSYIPWDPSKFDPVQFFNHSWDPGGMALSALWDFGDGTTSTEWNPVHQYTVDGDYTVQLTVAAGDGRSSAYTRVIQVRTHDVAITRFVVPQSASAGQTRQITVYVNNKVYDETVEVQLFKSTRGEYMQVGTLTLFVPSRPTNRTVPFAFSYTFTSEDAAMGKVTFRAVANLQGARDVLPADNGVIALPTKVVR